MVKWLKFFRRLRQINFTGYLLAQFMMVGLLSILLFISIFVLFNHFLGFQTIEYHLDWPSLMAFALFILICIIGAVLISTVWWAYPQVRRIKKRLVDITDSLIRLKKGKYRPQLRAAMGTDELSRLEQETNSLAKQLEQQIKSLQKLSTQNYALVKKVEQATAAEERRNIARDLHDAVSQQLFAVSMLTSALPHYLDRDRETVLKQIEKLTLLVHQAQQELRAIILHLRPFALDGEPLDKAISSLLTDIQARNPQLSIKQEVRIKHQLPPEIEEQLYRIVQEALSNFLRHAQGSLFHLQLFESQKVLTLIMEDNGKGFVFGNQGNVSYGLQGMAERVHNLGGHIDFISAPKRGLKIKIELPIVLSGEEKENGKD